ncbi:DUF5316 family protein [Sporolactobacillus vineae]|uniref:DUF5316 family protein n=1 Tax=Sporolactobacillus vineae TaxID=444463 RepID=UPI000289DE5E|nr:DUF5316 family protein [Sporolactobacillus vineae]
MKKVIFFLIGAGLGVIFFILGIALKSPLLFMNISGIAGLISLFISGTTVGAFVSGDRVRANYWSETKTGRKERIELAIDTALLGLPLLAAAICIYFVSY